MTFDPYQVVVDTHSDSLHERRKSVLEEFVFQLLMREREEMKCQREGNYLASEAVREESLLHVISVLTQL